MIRTQRTTRWAMLGIAGMTALALIAGACGGDDDDGGDSTPQATREATTAATSAANTPAATAGATEPAGGNDTTISVGDGGDLGSILVGPDGMTLYTFMNDSPGGTSSACNGACATAWPPLTVDGGAPTASADAPGTVTTFEREDGTTQVAYNGQPLYYYAADAAPGDTNGHEVGGIWFVAEP